MLIEAVNRGARRLGRQVLELSVRRNSLFGPEVYDSSSKLGLNRSPELGYLHLDGLSFGRDQSASGPNSFGVDDRKSEIRLSDHFATDCWHSLAVMRPIRATGSASEIRLTPINYGGDQPAGNTHLGGRVLLDPAPTTLQGYIHVKPTVVVSRKQKAVPGR